MRRLSNLLTLFALSALTAPCLAAPPSDEAVRLRNLGFAELENERPAEAEAAFRKLAELVSGDPLPDANLAIALLRQQKFEEAKTTIEKALDGAPGEPRLLAIQGEILQWSGAREAALGVLRQAAAGAPDDPEIQYALFRLATTQNGDKAEAAADEALDRLAGLRPENLIVMTELGQRARDRGDRTAASGAFLRLRELTWQAPAAAATLIEQILEALAAGDLDAARVPSLRLENLLKVTPMHRESLRELATGIQGVPIARFADEPPARIFGKPLKVRFTGRVISAAAGEGRGLVTGDFDGDSKADVARLVAGEATTLEVRRGADGFAEPALLAAPGAERLLAADLDNDGRLDLLAFGAGGAHVWRGGEGGFESADLGLGTSGGTAAAAIDFDIEGDLDVALAGGEGRSAKLFRNALDGPLEEVGERVFPELALEGVRDLVASDLDRDGDLDLLVAHDGGLTWLDNLRQGRFTDRTAAAGLNAAPAAAAVASADFDGDGLPDLALAGRGLAFYRNTGGAFTAWEPGGRLATSADFSSVVAFDADNDGRLDLAVAGEKSFAVLALRDGRFEFLNIDGGPAGATAVAARDLDGDGDLDLVAHGAAGLHRLDNEGGNKNGWLSVRLRGLDKGNSKNNLFGLGSALEVRSGTAYQFREATGDVTHFGLGEQATADLLRVVWTNGVPQNRLATRAEQTLVEEQVLKGSCPFLYAWNGEEMAFVTDLLWGAPIGLPVAPGVWAGADPDELVAVRGALPRNGVYEMRVTEELWEAALFDHTRLWVVDHPEAVEVASNLRIVPGRKIVDRVLGTRALRPVANAVDARGSDVTERVALRDEIYADGWLPSAFQGVAARQWAFTFDLGEAPDRPIRLHLDGWIFPTDASLNLALAQRGYRPVGPRLEVETGGVWRPLVEMGLPAGKTKTMVIDTPALPEGARRLRIVSTLWLSWDRIAWSTEPADGEPIVVARLLPESAELDYRGFSAPIRQAPNAPHAFDYSKVTHTSPWLPFPGSYTRYGDVLELLAEADDRSVILAAGDELALAFDASHLPPPPAGWRRTVFLESHGWDKDADRNTWEPDQLEPLPFRAMSGYPYGPGESFPDTPIHREYRERWLTREVGPEAPTAAAAPGR